MTKQIKNTAVLLACALLFGLLPKLAFAQTQVKGIVTDAKGAPLEGASVKVRGEKGGTTTKADGSFEISLKDGKTLDITDVGYNSQSIKYTGAGSLDVKLTQDAKSLSEVVVTGVGVATSKKKVAIAVESITADKLPFISTGAVGDALVGKIAGAQISSKNGSPGAPVNILLRGINSIRGGTAPMILVDGVEVRATGLESLDLNSYDRIEVVQGPAAASLYGAQGANGVIQLFSKKGKVGKINIGISSSISQNTLLNIGNVNKARKHSFNVNANGEVLKNATDILAFDNVTGSYKNDVPIFNLILPTSLNNKEYGKNLLWYDHYKMFFKPANTYNNSISISSSKEKTDFSFIVSDNKQETVFKGNGDFRRTNLTTNIGVELAKGLKFRTTTQLVNTVSTMLDATGRDMLYYINNSRPFANYEQKDAAGLYSPYYGDAIGVNSYNFNYALENSKLKEKTIDIIQSLNLNYKLNKFVELDAKYGFNRSAYNKRYQIFDQSQSAGGNFFNSRTRWLEYYSPRTSYGSPTNGINTGEINNQDFISTFQNFNTNATIKFDLEKDFRVKFPLNSTTFVGWDYRKRSNSNTISYGVDAPSFSPYTAINMATYQIPTDNKLEFTTYGYLVNQKFEYSNLGGFSVGFRSDYSSAFGRGSKPFTFPRGDAFLNLSSFNFYENSKISTILSDVKFRAAYGEAGIQPGAYDRFLTLNTANLGTQSALLNPITYSNPDLEVEVAKELEIGTDLRFKIGKKNWFKDATVSFTIWNRTAANIIDEIDIAPSIGLGRQLTNLMDIKSNGIQASLNLQIYSSKSLSWNMTTNYSKQNSKIGKIKGGSEIIKTSAAGSSTYVIKEGEKIGQLYGYLFLNQVDAKDANGNLYIPAANHGLWEVASNGYVVNKTSKQPFATGTKYAMGDPNPKFNMSFINEFNFKSYLTLGFQLDWVYKSNLYNQTKQWMYRDGIHQDYDNPITIDGQTEAYTAFYRGAYAVSQANGTKSYFYEDASFLRLRNLSIGFDVAQFRKIKGLSKCQLVLSGRNLWTKTKYTGMDPEVSSGTTNSSFDRGVDHNTIPNLKSLQIGLNLGF